MAFAYARVWRTGAGNDGGGVGVLGIERVERTGYGSGGGGVVGGGGVGVGVGGRPQPRARRTQRRVTHNEKRYHSGSATQCTIQRIYTYTHIHIDIDIYIYIYFSFLLFPLVSRLENFIREFS